MMHDSASEGTSTMVRPRLPDAARLERTITVRLTADDIARLEAVGARLGLKPMTIARRVLLLGLARLEREGFAALEDAGAIRVKRTKPAKRGGR